MSVRTIKKTVYLSSDDKEFDTWRECLRYEYRKAFESMLMYNKAFERVTIFEDAYYLDIKNDDYAGELNDYCDEAGIASPYESIEWDALGFVYFNEDINEWRHLENDIDELLTLRNKLRAVTELNNINK